MRVLWLTNSYPHLADPVGGTFLKTQAEALARAGTEVHVIAPVPWVPLALRRKWQRYKNAPHTQLEAGVKVTRPRYLAFPLEDVYGASHLFLHGATQRALRREYSVKKFDLIHAHFAYPQGLVARALSTQLGVPYVLTLHGSDVNTNPQRHPVARRRFVRAVRGAAQALAVSQPLARRTEALAGVTPEVSPVGLNLRHFADLPSRAEARRQLGLPAGAFIALYVGYLYEAKGIREWLAALTNLNRVGRASEGDAADRDVLGLFIGDGPLRGDIERTPNTRALGSLPNAAIPRYLAAADMLVLPSHAEGMPTVLIEAGAAGLPVVATDVGGIPDLLAEGRGCTVPPRSAEVLTDAVRRVRADPAAAQARAARLQTYAQRHYDADENARRLLRLYRAVAGREAPTHASTHLEKRL